MKKNLIRYKANPLDYNATVTKARRMRLKVELGGGRPTKSGESPNAQIILNLKSLKSKIVISRTGIIEIYYPSNLILEKCLKLLEECYVSLDGKLVYECEGPIDPFDFAFEYTITYNWERTKRKCAQAKVNTYQVLDRDTGEYFILLPNKAGHFVLPQGNYSIVECLPITITAVDKEDKDGNRIITAEKLVWQGLKELRRIAN